MSGCVDDVIVVKEGAKVIFTANDTVFKKYRNGTFGVIEQVNTDEVVVKIDGKSERIKRRDFPIYTYSVCNNSLSKKELGVVHQFPFRIGKAITIHKSQGQTFDKVIISPEIFAAGQLYVALSRVRSPEGLTLLRDILPEHLIIDPTVQKFYDDGYTWKVKPVKKATSTAKKSTGKTAASSKSSVKKTAKKPAVKRTSSTSRSSAKKKTSAKKSVSKPKTTKIVKKTTTKTKSASKKTSK